MNDSTTKLVNFGLCVIAVLVVAFIIFRASRETRNINENEDKKEICPECGSYEVASWVDNKNVKKCIDCLYEWTN
jgi:formate dehydrogenase maturation protein FdhE